MEHAPIARGFPAKIISFTPFERPTVRRFLKTVIALATAASIPLIATAPANAALWTPDLSSFTFDCDIPQFGTPEVPVYESSISLTFVNCAGNYFLEDLNDTGNAVTASATVDSLGNEDSPSNIFLEDLTVSGDVTINIYDSEHAPFASIEFVTPYEMPNPDGTQLASGSQDLAANAPEATWGTAGEISDEAEIQVGDIEGCEIVAGDHVYATQSFTVSTAGDYTFRVTGVEPVAHYFDPFYTTRSELDDPMVALYSTFNTAATDSGIVGCNDDLNDLVIDGYDYGDFDYNISQQGDYIEGHFSYFSTTLDPGDYMLVFTTWGENPQDVWAEETPDGGTVYFDVWGPANGLDLTDVDPVSEPVADGSGKLADTGVEPAMAMWSGLFLVAAGAVIMIARRRAQRA